MMDDATRKRTDNQIHSFPSPPVATRGPLAGSDRRLRPARRALCRRGAVTLWTILAVPFILTILCAVVELGGLWQARVQLENALEAGALAAVQEWGQQGGTVQHVAAAETAGKAYARANVIQGTAVDLDNGKVAPAVAWAFGTAMPRGSGFDFIADPQARKNLAVVVQATVSVPAIFRPVFGRWLGGSSVTAATAAYYDQSGTSPRPRLIRINDCCR
jgi:Flp pilus assembly protein TadG